MPQEFDGDLTGAEFWGADLSGATFRDVNLTGARISHAWVVDVEVDALVERLVVNGVDVTAYVNQRDPWFPLRSHIRPPATVADARAAWTALEAEWDTTLAIARALPEADLHRSVNGEFSFVETLRHLVFAMDKWFTAPVLGEGFSPIGMPNRGSVDFPWPGLDFSVSPPVADVLAVRAERAARFRDQLLTLSEEDLGRTVDVLENGPHPIRECLFTVVEEEFWHNRYARRDLELLTAAG